MHATSALGPAQHPPERTKPLDAADAAPSSSAMWDHMFGEGSTGVGAIARVQAPKGVRLRVRPLPNADSPHAPIPFNGLVHVERRTLQSHPNERWCYVIAETGDAGFCEERYLAIDPPEPTAKLRPTAAGERLAEIAAEAFGAPTDESNSRLQVQALYIANRDRAGVKLDRIGLSPAERLFRDGAAEQTLEIYKSAKVVEGTSLWIPSKTFLDQLKAAGAVSGGSTYLTQAWGEAKAAVDGVVDGTKYLAGAVVGLMQGAYNAIVDLFKGAVDMLDAVLQTIWNLVTGNLGAIENMVLGWVSKMKGAWEHRGEIADHFLRKWNATDAWERGLFQGEVLGWVMMTVLLFLVTMGEGAPASVSAIVTRWPQLVKLIQAVDIIGDVTTYLGAATKAVKLPAAAARYVAGKAGRAARTIEHATEDLGSGLGRAEKSAERTAADAERTAEGAERATGGTERTAEDAAELAKAEGAPKQHGPEPKESAAGLRAAFRRAKKINKLEAVSLKRLRIALGQAGATPGKYKLVRATEKELEAVGGEAASVYGWVARDGTGAAVRDVRGRPIITFTPKGLSSLEEAVKTFGHEVKHLKDFAAGLEHSSEALAEEAGERLWLVVQAMRER